MNTCMFMADYRVIMAMYSSGLISFNNCCAKYCLYSCRTIHLLLSFVLAKKCFPFFENLLETFLCTSLMHVCTMNILLWCNMCNSCLILLIVTVAVTVASAEIQYLLPLL